MIIEPEFLYDVITQVSQPHGTHAYYSEILYLEGDKQTDFNKYTLGKFLHHQKENEAVVSISFYKASVVSGTVTLKHESELAREWTPENGWKNETE